MMWAVPSKRLGGMTLWGDMWDLKAFYEVVHKLCEEHGHMPYEVGEYVLGLAYEIRKAFDRFRLVQEMSWYGEDTKPVYGTELPFVPILLQANILRGSAAYTPLSTRERAILLSFEACIHEALNEGFGKAGDVILNISGRLRSGPWEQVVKLAESRNAYFLGLRTKTARRKSLDIVMLSLDLLYESSFDIFSRNNPRLIKPETFEDFRNMPYEFYNNVKL